MNHASKKISHNTPRYKENQSKIMTEIVSRPGFLEMRGKAISEGKKGKTYSDAHKNAISKSMKLLSNNNPDAIKERNSAISKSIQALPEEDYLKWRSNCTKNLKNHYDKISEDPILYMKHWESRGRVFWASGQIIDKQPPNYCELWKDVNPRVHAFFNYECCLCGKKENGRSHTGHHVFYVKEACCWYDEKGIYYTNLNAKDHKEHDYCIGENPNYFVILCPTCHGKTNGRFAIRKKYADFFKNLIDTQFGGKCYFTKEEMGG